MIIELMRGLNGSTLLSVAVSGFQGLGQSISDVMSLYGAHNCLKMHIICTCAVQNAIPLSNPWFIQHIKR